MKKILTTTTKIAQAGFAVKGMIDLALHPIKAVRNTVKKVLIKTIVFVVKQVVSFSMKGKVDSSSHAVIRQLNALTDSNVDMTGLTKHVSFNMTLDTLLTEAQEVEEYKILKYIDLTKVKNKISAYKNSLRNDAYEYIVENDFENMKSIVNGVNEVLRLPTEIVGCEFVTCKINVDNHDSIKKEFVLRFNIDFAVKSSK